MNLTCRRFGVPAAAAVALAIPLVLPVGAALAEPAAGIPVVGGGAAVSYTERAAPAQIGGGVTVSGGGSYAGSSVEFAVTDSEPTETLGLLRSASPVSTAGAVSVVGSSVYLGNGTGADIVGSIDDARNGAAGAALRVNFTSAFANAGFESGDLTGWTAINSQIDLGVTSIAGCVPTDTSTYPGTVTNQDNNVPGRLGSLTTTVVSDIVSEGTHALSLKSTGMTTLNGYDVVHGPAVYSDPFEASAGDTIYFDWRAYAGQDDYHMFGYLIDAECHQIEVMDATGGGNTAWTTKATVIPTSGTYRFVFVSGTFDRTGGRAAGASLYIDNVKVFGTKVTDAVVQDIARKLTYANTSHNPPATRTVTVAATNGDGTGSGPITVNIKAIDEAPVFGGITPPAFTNTAATDGFTPVSGALTATDPEADGVTFGLTGSTARATTVGGVAYTHVKAGNFGTLYLDAATGKYTYVPDAKAINARTSSATDHFEVTATARGLTTTVPFDVAISVPPSAPSAPHSVAAVAGDGAVALSWKAPWWTGGAVTSGYRIETSGDGVHWSTAVASVTGTSHTVTGLPNGAKAYFRVLALNANGTSAPSAVVSATPRAVPGAPAVTSVMSGNRSVALAFDAPAPTGSPVLRYEYTLDGGNTWNAASGTASPVVVRGLENGVEHVLRLRAVTAEGAGAPSAAVRVEAVVAPVTPDGPVGSASPDLDPGHTRLLVDGDDARLQVTTTDRTVTLNGGDFGVTLAGRNTDEQPLAVDDAGRLIVETGGFVYVSGHGFKPGSLVDVWMFSTPQLLGKVTVGSDGRFSAQLPLPRVIAAGDHTLQLNGVHSNGSARSVSVGLIVKADPTALGELPYTGADTGGLAALGGGLVLVGAAAVVVARRRPVPATDHAAR